MLLFVLASCANKEEPNEGMKRVLADLSNSDKNFAVIPLPDSIVKMEKGKFQMNSKTKIYTAVETISEAYYLLSFLKGQPNNIRYRLDEDMDHLNKYGIYLMIDRKMKEEEGYSLKITKDYIKIVAKNEKGVFYGIQTLRQLMPDIAEEENAGSENKLIIYVKRGIIGNNMTVPTCEIYDSPKFLFRGMKLDVSRHFFSIDFIKKYIDMLAMHKMNYFIWHLSDDQGWRIEIKSYPELTAIGARRAETIEGKNFNPFKGDGKEYFHFYTQEDIREIVDYAKDRHIEIIPEISFPGHASAILAAYPGLGGQKEYNVKTEWGEFDNYIYPTSESLLFFKSVFNELKGLFPSKYIQVSGLGARSKYIEDKELKNLGFQKTSDLDDFFINNLKNWSETSGKKMIIGDIASVSVTSRSQVVLMADIQKESGKHKNVIILDNQNFLDFSKYPTKKKDKDQISFGGYLNTKDVYLYHRTFQKHSTILGAEATLRSDYIFSEELAFKHLLPRLPALSEVLWSNQDSLNWYSFKSRFNINLKGKLDKRNYDYSPFF